MKILFFLMQLIYFTAANAETEDNVIIKGKIGGSFDESYTKVIDSSNQEYFVPTSSFPKDFKFKEGKMFQIEIREEVLANIKLKRK